MIYFFQISIALLLILFTINCAANAQELHQDYMQTQIIFNTLKNDWEKEKSIFSSSTSEYWKGPAGQSIIDLGKKALPFVMDEISRGNFFFNIAAERITDYNFRMEEKILSEQEISSKWMEWWKRNRTNPNWNVFIVTK